MDQTKYIDISPVISSATAVFPGDEPFARTVAMSFKQGHHLELSAVRTSVHIGAHADSPGHYSASGEGIDTRDLNLYMGRAQVIAVRDLAPGARITVNDLKGVAIQAARVLFRTDSFPNPDHWNSDFNSLSPELVDYLHSQGVRLVGIDTPSIDPEQSQLLESHARIAHHNMAILEGLVLTAVIDGVYHLVALPLRLKDCDASPVRAVLIP